KKNSGCIMNKTELVYAVAEVTGLSKKDTQATIEQTLDVVKSTIKSGDKVQLIGFGNFEPKTNKARAGINPATKQPIQIKASKSVKFKVGKAFKDSLN